ncbi:hypothetical protein [Ruminococcus sp. HUN007]|uniref:hypothetical protein n=1 Tax=Ruminococcus sp. HUN007 TaxID=1514668 RepID=UPI0005D2469E|nr:hypothetical protein [Ruminococcus sp. HUN007]
MFKGKYKFAEKVVEIKSVNDKVQKYCAGYESENATDFSVETNEKDIENEKEITRKEYEFEGKPVPAYSDGVYESTAVYRKIAEKMPDYDSFVFHGSVIAVDGEGYLFTAKSGTGKSTHTRLWREYFGEKAVMVNDDKPIIKVTDDGVTVYGTPYNGKHRLGTNISVPLKAICILERGEKNEIVRISKSDAYAMLLQQVYRPKDALQMAKTLRLIDEMADSVRLYRLACNMDIEAAKVAYSAMKE